MNTNIEITNPNYKKDIKFVQDLAMVNMHYPHVIAGGCPTDLRFGRSFKDIDIWIPDLPVDANYVEFLKLMAERVGADFISGGEAVHAYTNTSIKRAEATVSRNGIEYTLELMSFPTLPGAYGISFIRYLISNFESNVTCNFTFRCPVTERCLIAGQRDYRMMTFKARGSLDFQAKTILKYLSYYRDGWTFDPSAYRHSKNLWRFGVAEMKKTKPTDLSNCWDISEYYNRYESQYIEARTNLNRTPVPVEIAERVLSLVPTQDPFGERSTGPLSQARVHQGSASQELQSNRGEASVRAAAIPRITRTTVDVITGTRSTYLGPVSLNPTGSVLPSDF